VSRRVASPDRDLVAVTASGVPYHRFGADDVLIVDFEVEPVEGEGVPSSESLAHMAVYRARPDVGAVVHTHSVYASALAVAGHRIPPIIDEQVVALGGAVEVAQYGQASSETLACNAVNALGERAAVLLRNHGVLAAGRNLDEAVAAAVLVERLAQTYAVALSIGDIAELPAEVVRAQQTAYRMMRGLGAG
jgi:L-fuculose-phosphate aldolase